MRIKFQAPHAIDAMVDFHTASGETQIPQRIQTGNADGVGATPLNIDSRLGGLRRLRADVRRALYTLNYF